MAVHSYKNYSLIPPPVLQGKLAPYLGGQPNWDTVNTDPTHALFKWKFDSFFYGFSIETINIDIGWGRRSGFPVGNATGWIRLKNGGSSFYNYFTAGPSSEQKTWTSDISGENIANRVIDADTEVWFYFEAPYYYRPQNGVYYGFYNYYNGLNHNLKTATGTNPPSPEGDYVFYHDTGQPTWYFIHYYDLDDDPIIPVSGRLINRFNRIKNNIGPILNV